MPAAIASPAAVRRPPDAAQVRSPRPPGSTWRENDQIIVTSSVSWASYVAMRALCDTPGIRMAYNQGVLEIMSPSVTHEGVKTLIGRLLETFAIERNIELQGYGSTTLRKEIKERGLEPDECYCVGREMTQMGHEMTQAPDFAIEVVISGGGIDKLPIYASLGVREVWFWCEGRFQLFRLVGEAYEPTATTELMPGLDLDQVARHVEMGNQHQAVRAFLALLRK